MLESSLAGFQAAKEFGDWVIGVTVIPVIPQSNVIQSPCDRTKF
jgi:hypothetical protein